MKKLAALLSLLLCVSYLPCQVDAAEIDTVSIIEETVEWDEIHPTVEKKTEDGQAPNETTGEYQKPEHEGEGF